MGLSEKLVDKLGCVRIWTLVVTWFNMVVLVSNQRAKPDVDWDYCEFDSLRAECAVDEVIVMKTALYGRMSMGRCVEADLGFVGCSSNVLDIADELCSGRRKCKIDVPKKEMKQRLVLSKQKCLKDLTTYLKASYTCHKVMSYHSSQCRSCDFVKVTEPSGTIASYVTKESGCGSPSCPWLLTVPPGQRINITLYNFKWTMPQTDDRNHLITYNVDPNRQVLATIKENYRSRQFTVYRGHHRKTHAYTSLSNTVELRLVPGRMTGADQIYFMFKYQAIGCVDPEVSSDGWFRRDGDTATLGCNHTTHTVTWSCHNSEWAGPPITCQDDSVSAVVGYVKVGSLSLSFGLSITVIVVLAAVICVAIVCVGLVVFRRRRAQRHSDEPIYQPPPYMPPNYRDLPPSYDKGTTKRHNNAPREENGYTHIWQRPLPDKPQDMMTWPPSDSNYVQEPGSVHYGYNSIASIPKSKQLKTRGFGGDTGVMGGSGREGKPGDTRYFQLEDRVTSNHVSA